MDAFCIVRPEHLNHKGCLFGGQMLKWVDEYAWIGATRDYPGATFLTRAMDKVEFRRSVYSGAILRFEVSRGNQGTHSVSYTVEVFGSSPDDPREESVFTTKVTFVSVDADGKKSHLR